MAVATVRALAVRNARLIVRRDSIAEVESFECFLRDSTYAAFFRSIAFVDDHRAACSALDQEDYKGLFVENDQVSDYLLYYPRSRGMLGVIEEGIGTYTNGFLDSCTSTLARLKWRAIALASGCGLRYGHGRSTRIVAVTEPEIFGRLHPKIEQRVVRIPSITESIAIGWHGWMRMMPNALPAQFAMKRTLILGTWGGAPSNPELAPCSNPFKNALFKAHPHDDSLGPEGTFKLAVPRWMPAEAAVLALAKRIERLRVLHYSSSAAWYLRSQRIDFMDLRRDRAFVRLMNATSRGESITGIANSDATVCKERSTLARCEP